MPHINRRIFLAGGAVAVSNLNGHFAAGGSAAAPAAVSETLRSGIARRKIPVAVGMVAGANETLYVGAFGKRDGSGPPVAADALFRIASMAKAITTVAALQLVEQGKVDLSEPVSRYLPQLANLDVLEGFDAAGMPSLRPAKTQITLRHLLAHTSGFCYDIWDERMFRYTSAKPPNASTKPGPQMFEPGTSW
jgi:methyl acetate hydrolase